MVNETLELCNLLGRNKFNLGLISQQVKFALREVRIEFQYKRSETVSVKDGLIKIQVYFVCTCVAVKETRPQ